MEKVIYNLVFNRKKQLNAEGKALIHERAFSFCPNLKKATLSPGVRLAGMMSFIYCKNLEEVVFTEEGQGLPGPVETMLIGCNKLKKIIVHAPVTENKYNFNSEKWDTSMLTRELCIAV